MIKILPSFSRFRKGHAFEFNTHTYLLEIPNVDVIFSNPDCYDEWEDEHWKSPVDIIISIAGKHTKRIECKYRSIKKLYHSWFIKNFYYKDCDIIVTNNPSIVSYEDRRLLDNKGVKLFSTSELKVYIGRLTRNILRPTLSKYNIYFNEFYSLLLEIFYVKSFKNKILDKFRSLKKSIKSLFSRLSEKIMSLYLDYVINPVLDKKYG